MKKQKFIYLVVFLFLISACENSNDKKVIGQIIGAAVGGYLGSKVGSGTVNDLSIILGGAAGYILGGKIIQILDENEKDDFNNVIEESLNNNPDNLPEEWVSSENNEVTGKVIPLNNYKFQDKDCRDFKKVIRKKGEVFEETSTACRDHEGNWVLI